MERAVKSNELPAIARSKLGWSMLLVSLLIIGVFLFSPPVTIFSKTQAIGYAVCHQIPSRTFTVGGQKLPLCARCTGIYLGVLLGFGVMLGLGRKHSTELPPAPILFLFLMFIGLMGVDGINSYLSFFPNAPHLYEPQNWLRLTTGTLHGIAMSALVFPVLMQSLWAKTVREAVIKNFKELGLLLAGAVAIILLVLWRQPLLLYPLAILSTLGVLLMLGVINTALVLLLTRRERYALQWRQAVLPLNMGLALAFIEIGGIGWIRDMLTQALGLPI